MPTRPRRQATRHQNKNFPAFDEEQEQSSNVNVQRQFHVRGSKMSLLMSLIVSTRWSNVSRKQLLREKIA